MKKHVINFNWPATLSFSADNGNENERFSRGKLKVFYKGETADHRYFSDEFSEKLIQSLPYTPIVSYYDEEKDDFVGHATQQAIYGIVDPCTEISFETLEDGNVWAICDTVYYTERPDKVGEIAKKIEGHSQSLELDPKTVKYNVNYDEKRHFKNIEFTEGTFIGVSVLGKDQKPAFTGSEFFSCDEFSKKMEILKNYCESRKSDQNNLGDEEMNLQEFMKLSWGDISSKVDEALMNEYGNEAFTMIHDMFEDSAIVRWYSYIDGTSKLMRVKYTIGEDGSVTLGDVNEVHVTYEDVIVPNASQGEIGAGQSSEENLTATPEDTTPEINTGDAGTTEVVNAEETPAATDTPEVTPEVTPDVSTNAEETPSEQVINADATPVQEAALEIKPEDVAAHSSASSSAEVTTPEKVSVDNEQKPEENSSSTSFTESEREEFERNFKREEKVKLIDSFKEFLTDEVYNNFISTVDEVEMKDLTSSLVKASKQDETMRAFSLAQPKMKEENTLDSWVRKNL